MGDQGNAAALAELGEQLCYASHRGEAAEAARLLDLNAPVDHSPKSSSEFRSSSSRAEKKAATQTLAGCDAAA